MTGKLTRKGSIPALGLALAAVLAAPTAATPPGQNGKIIWQLESPRGFPHLYVANPDGSGAQRVFANARNRGEIVGTFSPTDENLVFFTRVADRPFAEDIYSGNLATGAVTPVIHGRSADIKPTVSPDGTKIAYFAVPRPRHFNPEVPPPPERIHIANLDGSGDRTITSRHQRSIDPDWSPDGSQLVYSQVRYPNRRRPGWSRLAVINADGTGRTPLTKSGGVDEQNPKWMPDGQTIVFERFREHGTRSDIATINPADGTEQTVLATRAWETNPIPSPDGTRIAFTSNRDRPGPKRLGLGFELYTMALDGSDIFRLTNNRQPDIFPDWQRLP